MAEGEEGGVKVTIENPNAAAEASAEAAKTAAEAVGVMAHQAAAMVEAQAAETVAEVKNDIGTLEADVSWLKNQTTELRGELSMMGKSLGEIQASIVTLLNPPEVLTLQAEVPEVTPPENTEGQKEAKTESQPQSPPKKRRLI